MVATADDMSDFLVSFKDISSLYSVDQHLTNLNEDVALFLKEFYEKNLEENVTRFKERCWQILEWCYENEQYIGNAVYLTFCLINVICLALLRVDLMSLSSMPVIKASSWNLSEGIPALLASPHNFMAANSVPDLLIFAINALGIGALFASIPVAILMAAGVIAAPILVPIALTLLPPYTDAVSTGYQLYQAVKKDAPDIKEKAITFGYSSLMAIGFSLLCAATLTMILCPPLAPVALNLMIAGISCLAASALLRIAHFVQIQNTPNLTASSGNTAQDIKVDTPTPSRPVKNPSRFTRFTLFAQSLLSSETPATVHVPATTPFSVNSPQSNIRNPVNF